MTGSGPTAVGFFPDIVAADRGYGELGPEWADALVTASAPGRDTLGTDADEEVWEFVREHPVIIAIVVLFAAYQVFGDALPSINLEQALEDISDSLGKWTYVVVGALAFLETGAFVGLVFPGETAVMLAGAIAGNGTTSIVVTIAIVWFSAWAGDTASFFLGQKLGKGFILKHGPKVRITPERFEQVEDYFGRYGGRTILVGRFIGLVRALAPFIAGSSGMTYRSFAPYSVLGTGLWAAAFSLLGYLLAEQHREGGNLASKGIFIFGGTIAILVGGYLAIRYMRESENRPKLARRLEETRPGAGVRGVRPADRAAGAFFLASDDAGQAGPRVHDDHGLRCGVALHRDRLRVSRRRRPRRDARRYYGVRDRGRASLRLARRRC